MALTLNGLRTGRAGAEELREFREMINSFELEELIEKLKLDYGDLLDALRELDPEGWNGWYDDEANVPDFKGWMHCEPAMTALRRRVAELRGWHEPIIAQDAEVVTRKKGTSDEKE